MKKIKVLELFGGICSFSKGLERAGIPYEIVDYVDFDKYATQAFNAIHGTSYEPQDIRDWDKEIEVDLICHGSPCQDFSAAGLQNGGDENTGTRSSLMWETVRIIKKLNPKYVAWENVKNLLSKKHKHNFDKYIETLDQLGYNSYYKVLNAKDFGIPQNRERVFTISIRKDIDQGFDFPQGMPLTKRLKDILEPEVDEKYYLSEDRLKKIKIWDTRQRENGRGFRFETKTEDDIARTVTASSDRPAETTYVEEPTVHQTKQMYGFSKEPNPQAGRIYDKEGISPTLDTCSGGNRMPKIEEPKMEFVGGYGETDRIGDGKQLSRNYPQGNRVYSTDGIATAQTADGGGLGGKTGLYMEPQPIKRRRTELGKQLRKAYENHEIPANENMRESYIADDGVMPTITCSKREQRIAEPFTVAVRGRSDGEWNESEHYQKAEPRTDGVTNTITGVQKDNYVAEPDGFVEKAYKEFSDKNGYIPDEFNAYNQSDVKGVAPTQSTQCGSTTSSATVLLKEKLPGAYGRNFGSKGKEQDLEGVSQTLCAGMGGGGGNVPLVTPSYRIRKLTAKECWRLMNRDDWEYDKAEKAGISSTQLYKIAGNSIVVACPTAIFSQLFGEKKWNKMSIKDRYKMVETPTKP